MGYNTTVIVLNDALDSISKDPDFGKKLLRAVQEVKPGHMADVSALGFVNAASVIETHHADETAIVAVGQNYGKKVASAYYVGPFHEDGSEGQLKLLRALADKLNYRVAKLPRRAGKVMSVEAFQTQIHRGHIKYTPTMGAENTQVVRLSDYESLLAEKQALLDDLRAAFDEGFELGRAPGPGPYPDGDLDYESSDEAWSCSETESKVLAAGGKTKERRDA